MRRFGIGTALALAGLVALVAGGIAVATRGDDATVSQVNEGYGPGGIGGPGGMGGMGGPPEGFRDGLRFDRPSAKQILERREEFARALGEELDKSSDEVLGALRSVFETRLDEAVKEEHLTQKQADRILECYDSAKCGPPGFGGPFHGGPPHGGSPGGFPGPPPGI